MRLPLFQSRDARDACAKQHVHSFEGGKHLRVRGVAVALVGPVRVREVDVQSFASHYGLCQYEETRAPVKFVLKASMPE